MVDVPTDDQLLDWANTVYKPLSGHVTFFETDRCTARETVSFAGGACMGYHEVLAGNNGAAGAYVCQLTIAAANSCSPPAARPGPWLRPRYATALPPALTASIEAARAAPMLNKQQRYDARMNLLGNACAKLADTKLPAVNSLAAAANATQVAPSAGATHLASERQRLDNGGRGQRGPAAAPAGRAHFSGVA
jgi:hypothetical protein